MSIRADQHAALVPQGTCVASKGRFRFCEGFGPEFVDRADGAIVSCDGKHYIDWVMGLGAITLGHRKERFLSPQAWPLPSHSEVALAEIVHEWVPCAQKVRFLKTGTDATSACVRLARTFTGRDRILTYGNYHGWADWSIAPDKKGVPRAVLELTSRGTYGLKMQALLEGELLTRNLAAIILEPVSLTPPPAGWLEWLREFCSQHGIVLIFDEVITGFRMAMGGAQSVYGVTPDLCAMGKGMGNGWPISLVAGRGDIMDSWSDTHISGTHFSDPSCMDGALFTLAEMARKDFWKHQREIGSALLEGTRALIVRHGLSEHMKAVGHPHWWCLQIPNDVHQTLWQQESLRDGVMSAGSHFVCLDHDFVHVGQTLAAYNRAFAILRAAIDANDAEKRLECKVNRQVFRRS